MKIAIYGKGGIGKSTISANLSAALAVSGKKVLQIGCDPKHDSTRLLLGGKRIVTALDYMKATPVALQRLDQVLHVGYGGIVCVEAGGPEPGVGCAGRGILSTFAMFDRLGLDMASFDVVLYDVLGDVVCGGFAVPLRRGFADRVYVVTSEEFMSIYAANNILKGVKNFDEGGHRLAGLILNSRGRKEDRRPVESFARNVNLPVKQVVPRSERFRRAEMLEKTLVEAFPDSLEAMIFHGLALDVLGNKTFYPARFLDEDSLDRLILHDKSPLSGDPGGDGEMPGGLDCPALCRDDQCENLDGAELPVKPFISPGGKPTVFLSKRVLSREPLHGCAFSGALATTTQIKDSVTVAHGPRSCTHIAGQAILSVGFRLFNQRHILLKNQVVPAVISSDMDESMVIYGGRDRLIETLEQAMKQCPRAVFLVTACPSGVIGDDPIAAVNEIRHRYPDVPVIPITSDGNLRGDYMQGVLNACMEGAGALVDKTVTPDPHCVNILAEKNIASNSESNFNTVAELLSGMGIHVNCRFVRNTSVAQLNHFLKAPLNLVAYIDYFGRLMADFIEERLGVPTASLPFPVGFTESAAWVREIAAFFEKQAAGEKLITGCHGHYRSMIKKYGPALGGQRLMIITYVQNVDWIVEAAFDLGMEVVKVCLLGHCQGPLFTTRYPGRFEVETDYNPAKRDKDVARLKPDLLLGNYTPGNLSLPVHVDMIPMCPDVGFYGGIAFAHRWATLIKAPIVEGWKTDGI
ncbi:NifH1 [Desulforapulum autotrophicum HRM2]|uniref:NifH1 n=1 Tax=Desulforapulum autotrophicum (strain ATCC 43914 / DSM 3382 / VKM B-1955 / HRM2) TaxID=177437 RepID=C0QKB4_DESAH|nr:nitrogenase component 1 [Desulforapulum autotrophicum]ACN13985.1 NifH1 [Desulforapulum autotrophicum HRM2]